MSGYRQRLSPSEQAIALQQALSGVSLVQSNPVSTMDLNDISETGTAFTTNPNPGTGQTYLEGGTVTRVANKALCELRLTTDDSGRFNLIFGNSIVPAGTSIFAASGVAPDNSQDQLDIQRENDNTISIDRSGSTADMVMILTFWVVGLPLFQEYTLIT